MRRSGDPQAYPTLREAAMACMSATELKQLARLTGGQLPTRKADLVERIVRHLAGDGLEAAWEELDTVQQAAVAEVVHSDTSLFDDDRFFAKYADSPAWGSQAPYSRIVKPTSLGFFFYGEGIMPEDLKERLEVFVPPPEPATLETLSEVPREQDRSTGSSRTARHGTSVPIVVHESERVAQRELLSVLRLVDAGRVSVGPKTRKPSARGLDAVMSVLEGGDFYSGEIGTRRRLEEAAGPIRAFAWPLLLQAGRLVDTTTSRLQLTKGGRAALSGPPAKTIRTLWRRWLDTTLLDELSRLDCVKGQSGKGKRSLTAVKPRRHAIEQALATIPMNRWFDVNVFRRYITATGVSYRVARNAWNLYVEDPHYGSFGYDDRERLLDERYLLCFLLEYASTLGILDVAFVPPGGARDNFHDVWGTDELSYLSRYDGLLYARVTALGAWCLGVESSYTPAPIETSGVLRVLPNYEVAIVADQPSAADRLALETYAIPVSDRVWRLEADRLRLALEAGRSMDEIREFLVARSITPLPDTVCRLLDDVESRATCIKDVAPARLLECRDHALAVLVAHDSRTRPHCYLAGERHLAVPAASEAAFRRALRGLGYILT